MDEIYICQFCSKESTDEEDFQTSIDAGNELGDQTCEECYDEMNE